MTVDQQRNWDVTNELSRPGASIEAGSFGMQTVSRNAFAEQGEDGAIIGPDFVAPEGGSNAGSATSPFGD
ncbi:hypothetical protein [Bradyrhizobium betae]|uniref:Uncharacterized protein n=1 Tax=Bradyrhizobium betae TaxID=244734 RepID=A0A5P6P9A2_9BRAD|nr:hypothetical protein [Bradyrhizobium betae]MCS3727204.1 hypothetical protein [Bradyrhizobium betae]QFI74882.1 hypothetical protein F8237_22230 [Bradyrhizobium betae]